MQRASLSRFNGPIPRETFTPSTLHPCEVACKHELEVSNAHRLSRWHRARREPRILDPLLIDRREQPSSRRFRMTRHPDALSTPTTTPTQTRPRRRRQNETRTADESTSVRIRTLDKPGGGGGGRPRQQPATRAPADSATHRHRCIEQRGTERRWTTGRTRRRTRCY